jgi:catechol 2,3-dioxygenase-like lactoylglutathione lyase family enzyme
MTLTQSKVHPTISVTDLNRAKEFYGNTLGLEQKAELDGHVAYKVGQETYLVVYQRKDAPKAENTVASFTVDDVKDTVNWLQQRGVEFEELDTPGFKTVNGIAQMGNFEGAWFKDPDGNTLAVTSAQF